MSYSMQPNQTIVNSGGAGSHGHYIWSTNPPPHPATMQEMPPFWTLRNQIVVERVPRPPALSPTMQSFPGITFSINGWGGVRVRDILRGTVTVDHSTDTAFADRSWRETTLALEWPGYLPNGSSDASRRRIKTIHRGTNTPITRQDFAIEIAVLIGELSRCARDKPVAHGCEDWAFSQNGVRMSDVYILSAHYYRNVWVPELYVH
ncbi:hypothetical protein CY34DRAFT_813616 [Suillus luteus UH-Slu-Lm8-n1]|uniref:Uncharacterized protein n=1 Tax=Suillus luteus UH-Slu-Lm8-n1 TaxID=930992 RepID=A0A0C9ZVJ8_9AGAM|nr:hypothetical protein CY34DRAFT_813616 [Suillus luteus UH-Slu-Lm8-n1]